MIPCSGRPTSRPLGPPIDSPSGLPLRVSHLPGEPVQVGLGAALGTKDQELRDVIGVQRLEARFPELKITAGALDRELDDNKYIRPGLGDFGDRLYGT